MSASEPRYAIYFVPRQSNALWRFGTATIGYDSVTGEVVDQRVPAGFDLTTWMALTGEPRRYGFHATLKAPFHLAAGASEQALLDRASRFAAARASVPVSRLEVTGLGSFVALALPKDSNARADVDSLAAAAVLEFEPMRRSLDAADRARRLRAPLTLRQIEHLDRYGYPYVLDDYRFHMTLTGSLPAECRERALASLAALHVDTGADTPVEIDAIAVLRQETRDSRFRVIARLPMAAARAIDEGLR